MLAFAPSAQPPVKPGRRPTSKTCVLGHAVICFNSPSDTNGFNSFLDLPLKASRPVSIGRQSVPSSWPFLNLAVNAPGCDAENGGTLTISPRLEKLSRQVCPRCLSRRSTSCVTVADTGFGSVGRDAGARDGALLTRPKVLARAPGPRTRHGPRIRPLSGGAGGRLVLLARANGVGTQAQLGPPARPAAGAVSKRPPPRKNLSQQSSDWSSSRWTNDALVLSGTVADAGKKTGHLGVPGLRRRRKTALDLLANRSQAWTSSSPTM
jgi:hypothetical protein